MFEGPGSQGERDAGGKRRAEKRLSASLPLPLPRAAASGRASARRSQGRAASAGFGDLGAAVDLFAEPLVEA